MLRNSPYRKSSPSSSGNGTTGRQIVHNHRSALCRRTQPPPREPRRVPRVPSNQPTGFICGWCRRFRAWSSISAFYRRLKFCHECTAEITPSALGRTI